MQGLDKVKEIIPDDQSFQTAHSQHMIFFLYHHIIYIDIITSLHIK